MSRFYADVSWRVGDLGLVWRAQGEAEFVRPPASRGPELRAGRAGSHGPFLGGVPAGHPVVQLQSFSWRSLSLRLLLSGNHGGSASQRAFSASS